MYYKHALFDSNCVSATGIGRCRPVRSRRRRFSARRTALFLLLGVWVAPAAALAQAAAKCGTANLGEGLTGAPTTGLCSAGTPTPVRGDGPWTWQCQAPEAAPDGCVAAPGQIVVETMPAHANLLAIKQAIAAAKQYFDSSDPADRDTTVVLKFAAGIYDFSHDTSVDPQVSCTIPGACVGTKSIDVTGIAPGPQGRLIFYGAGHVNTVFQFNPDQTDFFADKARRISIIGLHLTQDRLEASQGVVVNPAQYPADWVVIDIQPGFPGMEPYPLGLFNPSTAVGNGKFLRRYVAASGACNIDPTFAQLPYDTVTQDPTVPTRWWFHVTPGSLNIMPKGGDLIGIKSKPFLGQAYYFAESTDIMFAEVVWTRSSRGVFSRGTKRALIYDSWILPQRSAADPAICMSSSAGGPQIGEEGDPPTWGNLVDGLHAYNTGDDSIAVFNSGDPTGRFGTTVAHSFVTNSFARSVLLYKSPAPPNRVIRTETENCNAAPTARFSECLLETDSL